MSKSKRQDAWEYMWREISHIVLIGGEHMFTPQRLNYRDELLKCVEILGHNEKLTVEMTYALTGAITEAYKLGRTAVAEERSV